MNKLWKACSQFSVADSVQRLLNRYRAVKLPMSPQSFWYKTHRGTVRIGLSPRDCSRWAVWLDELLICEDFGDPAEAAFRAHRRDFSEASAVELFSGIRVPFH